MKRILIAAMWLAVSQVASGAEPTEKFALNRSYPALGHSSLDQQLGSGDAQEGDLIGGINLGFDWKEVVDEADHWSIALSNDLAKEPMTVDVTPRRCQKFKPPAGAAIRWTASTGESGRVDVDAAGLVTIPQVCILPGQSTTLTLAR